MPLPAQRSRASLALRLKLADLYPLPNDWPPVTRDAGINPGIIDLHGPAVNVWFAILEYARENNLTDTLAAAVLRTQAAVAGLAALFAAYADELARGVLPSPDLPGATIGEQVETARAGLDAVNRQSRAALAAGRELARVAELIDLLATYMALHDEIQSFQYAQGSFQGLLMAVRGMSADAGQARVLVKFRTQLNFFRKRVAELVEKLPKGPMYGIEQVWLDNLTKSTQKLKIAIDDRSLDAYDAVSAVRFVLRVEPSRLTQQIFATARSLPLGELAAGLEAVVQALPAGAPSILPIEAAQDAILMLSSTINARVVEHKLWQQVDNMLADLTTMIEPEAGMQEAPVDKSLLFHFSLPWRIIQGEVKTLKDLNPQGSWHASLDRYSTDIDDQLTRETVDAVFFLAFEAYRDEALQRFVQVDLALKRECAAVVRISEPLHSMLERLKW